MELDVLHGRILRHLWR